MRTVESSNTEPRSACPADVGALCSNPTGGIVVPRMTGIVDRTDRGFKLVPTPLVIERATDEADQKWAPLSGPNAGVQFGDEFVGKLNV